MCVYASMAGGYTAVTKGLRVTGQFADKPTCGQSSRGLVNSRTSQLAETFDLKFALTKCK